VTPFTLRPLTESDRPEWDALVGRSPDAGFMQSWDWSAFKELEGYDVTRLGVFAEGGLRGGAIAYSFPSPAEAGVTAVPDGPVLPWSEPEAPEMFDALMRELRSAPAARSAVTLRVEPRLLAAPPVLGSWTRSPLDLVPDETLVIALGPEAEMLSRMAPKGRYNVGLAARRGVEVRTSVEPGDVHEFYFVLSQAARYQNFMVEPKSFFINLAGALFPGRARFAFATYRGMTLGAALTVRFGDTVTYLYGGLVPLFRSTMASYALHWHLLREAAREGYRVYDFYGYVSREKAGHPYFGFSRFKERFGGTPVKRMGSRDLILYDRLADAALRILQAAE
jgi:lipid II:glycine glycyltransferase (peptidoglycan interpeptide bridge formation enzyme)